MGLCRPGFHCLLKLFFCLLLFFLTFGIESFTVDEWEVLFNSLLIRHLLQLFALITFFDKFLKISFGSKDLCLFLFLRDLVEYKLFTVDLCYAFPVLFNLYLLVSLLGVQVLCDLFAIFFIQFHLLTPCWL
jgi:hypothetical protein